VHFGGKFRIIDFALSNCMNSGIRDASACSRSTSRTACCGTCSAAGLSSEPEIERVHRPAARAAAHRRDAGTAAPPTPSTRTWTSCAANRADYIVVLAGDHVYKMDYRRMLADHVAPAALSCTVGCIEVPRAEASGVRRHGDRRAATHRRLHGEAARSAGMPGQARSCRWPAMGIYIFNAEYPVRPCSSATWPIRNSAHDFGRNVIPQAGARKRAVAHPFSMSCVQSEPGKGHYWRDVGTIDAYWAANIDLTATDPELNLYDTDWPIWTHQEQLPPAKFVHDQDDRRGMAIESLVVRRLHRLRPARAVAAVLAAGYMSSGQGRLVGSAARPLQIGRPRAGVPYAVIDRGCTIPERDRDRPRIPELDARRRSTGRPEGRMPAARPGRCWTRWPDGERCLPVQ
jgi:glucose-1-phosphate adenylyltransferase